MHKGPGINLCGRQVTVVTFTSLRAVDPVVMAIKDGDVKEVRRLIVSSPKSLTEADRQGWLPLHEAAYHGQTDCVMVLLKGERSSHPTTRINTSTL